MAKPIPVLLMVRELGIGGCERDLAKIARALNRDYFSPHVGCFISEGLRAGELREAGVPIIRFPVRSLVSWSVVTGTRLMGRYLREHGIRLVHTFDMPMDVFGVPAARLYRVPVVIASQLFHRDIAPLFYRTTLAVVDRLAHIMVTNSRAVQRHLIEDLHYSEDGTYLCYNGVDTTVFFPQQVPRPAAVEGATLVIGSVCALREEKRIDLLLEAFARVRHLRTGMKLLIVGSGEMLPALDAQRRRLGLEQDCHFEPAQTDVAGWMRAMDIFVLPSRSESFPNALMEAMACGCSVIGSSVGGIPELITHRQNGLLFPSGDVESLARVLEESIQDEPLRRRRAELGAQTAREQFSLRTAADRIEHLYRTLLQRAGVWGAYHSETTA